MSHIRLALVDDNPIYRHALVSLLQTVNEIEVVVAASNFREFLEGVTASNFREFLEGVADVEPDLILMDESVFWDLPEHVRAGFLGYVSDIPLLIMGLDDPSSLEVYGDVHPRMRFLSKESGGEEIVRRLLEMASYLGRR